MADQGLWFKLWHAALDDPDLANLDIADFGRWAKLGAFVKRHGIAGQIRIPAPARALCALLQLPDFDAFRATLSRFPNVREEMHNGSVASETFLTVSFLNWAKYQGDLSTARVRRFREVKRSKRRGEEKRREEKRREEKLPEKASPSPRPVVDWSTAEWGTPEALAHAYNTLATDNLAAVTRLTAKRRDRARLALRQCPEREWWEQTFRQYHRSAFLSGRVKPTNGHASFQADFDWLLASGKDGVENYAKVHDGRYTQ